MKRTSIPRFYLFGEPPKEVDHHFLHLEEIKDRSAPLHGQIRPHLHAELNHVFLIRQGSGRVLGETGDIAFDGPHILFVPAGSVHGFTFSDAVTGYVLTVASAYLTELFRAREALPLPTVLQVIKISDRSSLHTLRLWVMRLGRELFWEAPAHRLAIEANLLGLMTDIHRLAQRQRFTIDAPTGAHHRLMARFREQVETHYKTGLPLADYLTTLRVSETQLRYACQKVGEKSPKQIILDRRLIEAKRLLLYSDLSISDCSQQIGFDDPAYFSRLFTQHTGLSPREFRSGRRQNH